MSANNGPYIPPARPAEERPHVCGKCRNPFTVGNPAAVPPLQAEAWDEGYEDGVWNSEHEAMIERGNRERITNPYRKELS